VNRAGQNGAGVSQASGCPDYTINGYITYQGEPLSAQLQIRHIADGLFQATNVGPGQTVTTHCSTTASATIMWVRSPM
jgi:hypothetical protein